MLKVDKKKKEKDVSSGTPSYSGLFSDLSISLGRPTAESFQAASASLCCVCVLLGQVYSPIK